MEENDGGKATDLNQLEMMKLLPVLLDVEEQLLNSVQFVLWRFVKRTYLMDVFLRLQVKPSSYRMEMLLSTEERLEKLKRPLRKIYFPVQQRVPFKIVPDIVIFQNFNINSIYTVPLTLINTDTVSRTIVLFLLYYLVFV